MGRRASGLPLTGVVFGFASLAIAAGNAASLGGITAVGLMSVSQGATVSTPAVIGCDNFTGTTGGSMNGRAATVASACSSRVWTAHVGTWTIQSNTAASSATVDAVATENTTTADSTASVVLSNLNAGSRSGGLVISHNGTDTFLAAVMINSAPDRIELRSYNAGTSTVLATSTPTFTASNTLQLSRSGAAITTTVNGVVINTYTLTSAQQTALGGGARAGLFGGNSSVRFDDFAVISP
ncbi:MAG TPA: hypothetical protein VLD86_05635 [Ilumatobacteraceae bacterium]|nr:hypothetical protein [Ilumatobacteraceae bacterium]